MNSLERALVTKAGYDHGWEVTVEEATARVVLASALHRAKAEVTATASPTAIWRVRFDRVTLTREVSRNANYTMIDDVWFAAATERDLGMLLQDAARLARALPDAPEIRFEETVSKELVSQRITTTEVERMVRQRIGQDIYRESLMDYWGGACAVTGIAIPALLRASHSKGWAECDSDAERLNVFNGFLLTAHLDALFDRHLMSFDEAGVAIFAPVIDRALRVRLGLADVVALRWIRPEHQQFLHWHREQFHSRAAARPADGERGVSRRP